jgi:hypothetical protein
MPSRHPPKGTQPMRHPEGEILMPRLTEQEQQEIIRFIEADKPLPDKYRFLLFADKCEV